MVGRRWGRLGKLMGGSAMTHDAIAPTAPTGKSATAAHGAARFRLRRTWIGKDRTSAMPSEDAKAAARQRARALGSRRNGMPACVGVLGANGQPEEIRELGE